MKKYVFYSIVVVQMLFIYAYLSRKYDRRKIKDEVSFARKVFYLWTREFLMDEMH
jgi:hypothetical protein